MRQEGALMKKICLLLAVCILFAACPALSENNATEMSAVIEQARAALEAADFDTAVPLLRTAAEAGNDQAQLWLGNCYDAGLGVEQSAEEAVKYYRLAADQGNISAVYNLAFCYLEGRGAEQDPEKAEELLKSCADKGCIY